MSELVLVIDGDPVLRGRYRALLAELGCRMVACDHADIALNLVEALRPDLAIVATHVPGGSGPQLVCDIKSQHPDLPVLICSECTCYEDDFASWAADACLSSADGLGALEREIRRRLLISPPAAVGLRAF